jgi:hypothetical protein
VIHDDARCNTPKPGSTMTSLLSVQSENPTNGEHLESLRPFLTDAEERAA